MDVNSDFYVLLNTCSDDELVNILNKTNIRTVKTHDGRILFCVNLFDNSVKKYKLRYQCKGLIIDSLDKSIISMPGSCHTYYHEIYKNKIKELYENDVYDVIKARDGTTVTIYNFEGIFYMATSRSHNVSNYYWNGEKNFAEMFYESLQSNTDFTKESEIHITNTGNIKWNIPSKYCVTLGFRHDNIHKNSNDKNSVWFIRCYNRETGTDEDLPIFDKMSKNEIMPSMSWENVIKRCNNNQHIDMKENFYGCILIKKKSSKDIPIHLEKVFIPSLLYKTLKLFFYTFNKNNESDINHKNRYMYSIFYNIISENDDYISVLTQLNSSYEIDVKNYNLFLNKIIIKVSNRFTDVNIDKGDLFYKFVEDIYTKILKDESDFNINEKKIL